MGAYGLPALDIKTPQQPDLLEKYSQITALRNAQQQQQLNQQEAPLRLQQMQQGVQSGGLQLQQQQQALKDQQAVTAAMQQWDGKDLNSLEPLILKNGGSGQAVIGLKQKQLEIQKNAAETFKNTADAGKAQVETLKQKNDLLGGALSPLIDPQQVPDAQLPQALDSAVQGLVKQGLLDPQGAQAAEQLKTSGDPNAIRQGLGQFIKSHMALTQITEKAQKDAETDKANADAEKTKAETAFYKDGSGGAPGIPLSAQATKIYAIPAAQRTAAQNLFIKGYEKNNDVTRVLPAQVRIQGLMQMPQAVVDPNDPSREIFTTKKSALGMEAPASGEAAGARAVIKSAIGGKLGDTINSYNTASAHLDQLDKAADALKNGDLQAVNKIGNAFAAATGNPAPTNFQAVKSAVAGEVSKTFKGGQATDAEIHEFDSAISSANSPAQLKGVIQTYKALMNSKRESIQQQVEQGQQGKANFGAASSVATHRFNPATGKIEPVQ